MRRVALIVMGAVQASCAVRDVALVSAGGATVAGLVAIDCAANDQMCRDGGPGNAAMLSGILGATAALLLLQGGNDAARVDATTGRQNPAGR